MPFPDGLSPSSLRAYVDFLRDLGIYELYATSDPTEGVVLPGLQPSANSLPARLSEQQSHSGPKPPTGPRPMSPFERSERRIASPLGAGGRQESSPPPVPASTAPALSATPPTYDFAPALPDPSFMPQPPLVSFNQRTPQLPVQAIDPARKPAALHELRAEIGDCTRCPLAYAGRRSIVFADGDPNARLMFVGEGPGADEDETGVPFVGKAGQLLNNMIAAMGLRREEVYIANIVKCRPPKNRVPEPVEANTCSQFLVRQIDIVRPEVIVALGSTAATYLLGLRQSLSSLRGRWFDVRGSKCAVTYHPAFLLRDPRQKGEAWKDLQQVMAELKLQPRPRA